MQIVFVKGRNDGSVEPDLEGVVYLDVTVLVDGEREGSLTGYYRADVADHIKTVLGVNS